MDEGGAVVDASAVLALLKGESYVNVSPEDLVGAAISAVNYSEVLQKLLYLEIPADKTMEIVDGLDLTVVPFDADMAQAVANLWPRTNAAGLSLADRACLALGIRWKRPILTADKAWTALRLPGATIVAIR